MATKEFPDDLDEIGVALADGNYLLVDKKKSLLSRFWTYIQSKLAAGAVTVGSLVTSGTVDGRDVSTDGSTLDAHVASTSNPHAVTAAQAGAVAIASHAALSVIGRSANSTGDAADIAAANDGEVLRRSGTSIGFGTIATAGIADGAVTGAKIVQSGTIDVGAASITTTGNLTSALLKSGAGSPEGVTTASVGAIYRDTTNGWLWQKEIGSGNTGWRIIGASGSYTPTATIVSNLDSVTPGVCMYARVGNTVYVNGLTVIDPTANALSQWRLTLPVTSNLAAVADLSGGAVSGTAFLGWVYGDATNDAAAFDFGACGTAATNVRFWFSYRVL